ncbi:two-component sensor histidine kinase [Paenibacillus sp. GSMTC-2017]|uniref:sensor histidine kinase n=1 Tax=Paenibacillus sp. GSMTC-2017 TaxID=2794350 RepID=UPI0018D76235|nr:HAMP domain-containing sensor histidine kinase [Paenibacillus sp. GSMTC-2017]MBH5316228.1 two-component sensor histidine kinase [Paenibacillus sp. GSMTC-2017]
MNKKPSQLRWIIILLSLFVFLILALSLAYAGVSFMFSRWLPVISGYWFSMSVALAGFVLFCISATIISHMFGPRTFPIIDEVIGAMQKISKGDFDVNLEHLEKQEPFSELADNVRVMAKDLKRMEQLRQQFVSDVSHEIQSPLTSISGFAKVLRGGTVTDQTRDHYLAIIETESKRLSVLSDNLLKLASLDSEHHPFNPMPYRLDRQLREIALTLEPLWLEKKLSLQVELPEMTTIADEDLMRQVWINLLTNSIKFTPNDGEIKIDAALESGEYHVHIRDTGNGIPIDDLPRIFERFYKADRSRNRTQEGSGLGLSIVKRIIERHNGSIEVKSSVGDGTVMSVLLPRGHEHFSGSLD